MFASAPTFRMLLKVERFEKPIFLFELHEVSGNFIRFVTTLRIFPLKHYVVKLYIWRFNGEKWYSETLMSRLRYNSYLNFDVIRFEIIFQHDVIFCSVYWKVEIFITHFGKHVFSQSGLVNFEIFPAAATMVPPPGVGNFMEFCVQFSHGCKKTCIRPCKWLPRFNTEQSKWSHAN